jgi:fatty acid desaturase
MKTGIMSNAGVDMAGEANSLVRDLHRARPGIYWTDLLLSVAIGWGSFAAALELPRPYAIASTAIAALALYRALCFIHEISHQSRRSLPGFEPIWNLTTGFPLLLPSFMYQGVHPCHHRLSTYGTESDPEYLPFARSARMTVAFCAQSLLLPAALLVRFLMFALAAFLVPRFERWLVVHFSSLSMNVRYRREDAPEIVRMVRVQSAGILALWAALGAMAVLHVLPLRFFALWYVVSAFISLINCLRTLGAHAYASDGRPLSREEQLRDSIDTPAVRWGVLWAPVGLRFHGLHHYFPGIPYHNLGEAYRRLTTQLPAEAGIHKARSAGLGHSLRALYFAGVRNQRRKGRKPLATPRAANVIEAIMRRAKL